VARKGRGWEKLPRKLKKQLKKQQEAERLIQEQEYAKYRAKRQSDLDYAFNQDNFDDFELRQRIQRERERRAGRGQSELRRRFNRAREKVEIEMLDGEDMEYILNRHPNLSKEDVLDLQSQHLVNKQQAQRSKNKARKAIERQNRKYPQPTGRTVDGKTFEERFLAVRGQKGVQELADAGIKTDKSGRLITRGNKKVVNDAVENAADSATKKLTSNSSIGGWSTWSQGAKIATSVAVGLAAVGVINYLNDRAKGRPNDELFRQ